MIVRTTAIARVLSDVLLGSLPQFAMQIGLVLAALLAVFGQGGRATGAFKRVLLLCGAPALVAIALHVAKLYPISVRATAMLAGPFCLLLAFCLQHCMNAIGRRWLANWTGSTAWVPALLVPLILFTTVRIPGFHQRGDAREATAAIESRAKPGDVLFVYPAVEEAVRFYRQRLGTTQPPVIYGNVGKLCCAKGYVRPVSAERMRADLESLLGRQTRDRIWLLWPADPSPDVIDHRTAARQSLTARGCHALAPDAAAQAMIIDLFECRAPSSAGGD